MAKPSKLNFETKESENPATPFTAAEANTLFSTVDAVIDDYSSLTEGVDADTLEGSTKAQVQTHAPASHASSHQNGQADEISVAGLSGVLADAQTPASHGNEAHSSTFITSAALSGYEQQANKGEASGYAPLDEDSKVPNANLPFGYGETKLWDTDLNDIPSGWHVCDGTNGTRDMSAIEPQASTNTKYIMYIGGDYTSMTARTINVTNSSESYLSYELTDPFGNTITTIEDGSPFNFKVTNIDSGHALYLEIICTRDSDDYEIFHLNRVTLDEFGIELPDGYYINFILSQYLDCTWTISATRVA